MTYNNTIEEFIKGHKRRMINPQIYGFFGSYIFEERENYHEGWFLIDDKTMNITGKIIDYKSLTKGYDEYVADGFLSVKDDSMTMELLKIPINSPFSIYHHLEKLRNIANEITGYYKGTWMFVPNKHLNERIQLDIKKMDKKTHLFLEKLNKINIISI